MFRVTLEACVAGNPLKAWAGGEPDDEWEEQAWPFEDLEEAKGFVRDLPAETTTHVRLYADDELIFDQDADADHLEAAEPGVAMPHTIDAGGPVAERPVPPAPPVMPRQGDSQ